MHYIGNATIANYRCEYKTTNVIGSAVIAVVASNAALSIFFPLRASWKNSWWKRGLSGVLLAGAVSGMHWCASIGTSYRLIKLNTGSHPSRNIIVAIVTILSLGAALIVTGVVLHETWVARSNASKARQVVLAVAIFDGAGRILVNHSGLLPSEKITDTYIEKTPSDTFGIGNPLFQWMFQVSRNWYDISNMIGGMENHLATLSSSDRSRSVRLISDSGQLIEHYDVVFRELFCLAATTLASRLKAQLTGVGVLWDMILPTGRPHRPHPRERSSNLCERSHGSGISETQAGRGSLMFLVRRLKNLSDVEKLEAAGFRFADIHQVSGIIRAGMQIETPNLGGVLMGMSAYAEQKSMMEPGVHLGFFGIRARVGGHGFDVLVQRRARNRLPALKLPLGQLEAWHVDFLCQYDGFRMPSLLQGLVDTLRRPMLRESSFASILIDAIKTLRAGISDQIFDEALISCRPIQVPCRSTGGPNVGEECTMIIIHIVIPIHYSLFGSGYELIPLSFFKVHQMVYKNSPHQAAFTQHLYRGLVPAMKVPDSGCERGRRTGLGRLVYSLFRSGKSSPRAVDVEGTPIPVSIGRKASANSSTRAGSTFKLWIGEKNEDSPHSSVRRGLPRTEFSGAGGILVSQEIKVDITRAGRVDGRSWDGDRQSMPTYNGQVGVRADDGGDHFESGSVTNTHHVLESTVVVGGISNELPTFVDELFSVCIKRR